MSDDALNPHSAMIYLMVIVSAVDSDMGDAELRRIGNVTRQWPVFEGFDEEELLPAAQECAKLLTKADGLDRVMTIIVASLPSRLAPTAYAMACEVAAADGHVDREETTLLNLMRRALQIDHLTAAAIEKGVSARNQRL
ncbi:MAG: tellurite resistance TerB family protein [Alphaproteobacteria bacterium]